jgi:hypothetical protein
LVGAFFFETSTNNTERNQQMVVKLIANYAKRLSLPGYSSHQFSVSIETELQSLDGVRQESAQLYDSLQQAVDQQIQKTGFVPPDGNGQKRCLELLAKTAGTDRKDLERKRPRPKHPRAVEALAVLVASQLSVTGLYLPPVLKMKKTPPPHTIISLPVQTAECSPRAFGALVVLVAVQLSVPGLYLPPVLK